VKSISQIFLSSTLEAMLPVVEQLLDDTSDRHKQRAATEIIGGQYMFL
jgi:hypothetical protein